MSRCERRDNKKKKSVRRVSKEKKTDRSRGINLNVSFFSPKNWIFTRVNRVIINCNERLSSVYRGCTKGCINNGFLIKPVRSWTLPIPPFRDRDAGEPVRQPCSNFWTAKFRLTRLIPALTIRFWLRDLSSKRRIIIPYTHPDRPPKSERVIVSERAESKSVRHFIK